MFNGEWEVKVIESIGDWGVNIWLINHTKGNIFIANVVEGRMELNEVKVLGEPVPPTFVMDKSAWDAFKEAMVDKKVRDKNEVESELKATKFHLQDMRTLLKLPMLVQRQEVSEE